MEKSFPFFFDCLHKKTVNEKKNETTNYRRNVNWKEKSFFVDKLKINKGTMAKSNIFIEIYRKIFVFVWSSVLCLRTIEPEKINIDINFNNINGLWT